MEKIIITVKDGKITATGKMSKYHRDLAIAKIRYNDIRPTVAMKLKKFFKCIRKAVAKPPKEQHCTLKIPMEVSLTNGSK